MARSRIMDVIEEFRNKPCACGKMHETAIRDVEVGSGIISDVGSILKKNGFPKKLLLMADKNTLKAADGILESLGDFDVEPLIFDTLRVAEMKHVDLVREKIRSREIGVLSVGTGSLNDPCRLACAIENKPLCLFGTAPSMDGFASYSSPIVKDGFKSSYPAKSPEVIIADTKILASAPTELKSAGFGDMIAKYVGLVDWQISHVLTGEYYCERVANLTRKAVDDLVKMADKVTETDEKTAGAIFESLLLTGIGMSFAQNSRPASGAEHIVAHLIECVELRDGIIPNYHGEDVGVSTLETLGIYEKLTKQEKIRAHRESPDWDEIYAYYGNMRTDVEKLNTPTTCVDGIEPSLLEEKWEEIRKIVKSVPSARECRDAMQRAGCKLTVADIGKDPALFADCVKYSPYMRRRVTLLRLRGMID